MPEVLTIVRNKDLLAYLEHNLDRIPLIEAAILQKMGTLAGIKDAHDLAFDWVTPWRSTATADIAMYLPYSVRPNGLVPMAAKEPEWTKAAASEVKAMLEAEFFPGYKVGVWFIPLIDAGYAETE